MLETVAGRAGVDCQIWLDSLSTTTGIVKFAAKLNNGRLAPAESADITTKSLRCCQFTCTPRRQSKKEKADA
jgi:hypothetical protein